MDVDRGKPEACAYKLTVFKPSRHLLDEMRESNPAEFNEMVASIRMLAEHPNLFEINDCGKGLDLIYSYPAGHELGILRYKRKGGKWRAALSLVEDGVRVRADETSTPGEGIHLQIVWCGLRDKNTYGRDFVDLMSML